METIQVEKITHNDEKRLSLRFGFNPPLIKAIKDIPNSRWSQSLKAWHLPDTTESKVELSKLTCKGLTLRWADKIEVNPSTTTLTSNQFDSNQKKEKEGLKRDSIKDFRKSNESNNQYKSEIDKFERYLTQRRYSPNTIAIYTEGLKLFLNYTAKPVADITNKDLEEFSHDFVIKNCYSLSFQNQVINAVKLFFRSIYSCKFDIDAVERPRREHKLPNVLSKEEVKQILSTPKNLKHRAMLSLIYACGLRRSELLNLKPNDVDSKRGLLIVRLSKGNKDRIVPLSEKTILMLREYYKSYRPTEWLFVGLYCSPFFCPSNSHSVGL
ncbi:MAG TPA: hypothetical protein DIW31_10230, partial [Bacteroidales bacterium]|nr:hypothetical protein [Bacteroidales bacterium]